MIELDRTDEEREELVKQWIKNYWQVVAGAVVIAVGIVWGTNYYRDAQVQAQNDLAIQTEKVFSHLADKKNDEAKATTLELQKTAPETSFAALATLGLAKQYFEDGNYSDAIAQYDWLLKHADNPTMQDIVRLRKARALANHTQYDDAIATLEAVKDDNYTIEASLLKGDIYLAQKQYDKAQTAYESLLDSASGDGNPSVVTQRLNLLKIKKTQEAS